MSTFHINHENRQEMYNLFERAVWRTTLDILGLRRVFEVNRRLCDTLRGTENLLNMSEKSFTRYLKQAGKLDKVNRVMQAAGHDYERLYKIAKAIADESFVSMNVNVADVCLARSYEAGYSVIVESKF